MQKILLITSSSKPQWLESSSEVAQGLLRFASSVSTEDSCMYITTFDRLIFDISNRAISVWDSYNEMDIAEFDVIHMRNIDKSMHALVYAKATGSYAMHHGARVIEEVDQACAFGKLSQMMLFALEGLPVPHTIACWDNTILESEAKKLSMPIVVKANNAMKGADNHMVESESELHRVLHGSEQRYVAQEFIPNDGDYRVLFIGDYKNPLLFKRLSVEGSHLNNTSKGAQAVRCEVEDFDRGALELSVRAAQTVQRKVTGVDIMQNSQDKTWVLLEANTNPALSMGVFLEEKVGMYRSMLANLTEKDL